LEKKNLQTKSMIVTIRAMKTSLMALSSGCFYTRHMIPENM